MAIRARSGVAGLVSSHLSVSFGERARLSASNSPSSFQASALGLIAEQFGQAPVKGAPSAQSPLLQRFLGAAPAADVIIPGARAVTTDRFEEPGVAQQPACLPALRAGALGRKRLVVAGAAHRSLGPVRHRAPVATAVRAPLRLHGRTSAAQHPASALAAARADLPAVRAGDGRAGPADRAQILLTAECLANDRADPSAPPAGSGRPSVALLAPGSALPVAGDRRLAAHQARR
jgi:hypothetical protein